MSSFFEESKREKAKQFISEFWWIGLIALGVFLIGLLIWALTATDAIGANITNKYWKRTTDVLEYRWVKEHKESSFSYPDAPSGSRNVRHDSWTETIRHPAEYRSETYYTGSGENRESHTRRELVREAYNTYETHYKTYYEIQRWVFDRELVLDGNNNEPVWPEYQWDNLHKPGKRFQKFIYTFVLDNKEKDVKTFEDNNEDQYGKFSQNDAFVLSVNKFGAVLRIKQVSDGDIVSFEVN